jgi:hypothetical protein
MVEMDKTGKRGGRKTSQYFFLAVEEGGYRLGPVRAAGVFLQSLAL